MNPRVSTYSRLNSDYESIQVAPSHKPLEHNLDIKKLQSRCCLCISAALLIAFVLWMFDPPPGHEAILDPDNTDTQLKFVAALHRHGARSSLDPYTFEKDIEWDVDHGKLLDVGFQQGFSFGRHLRNQYWSTLSSTFDSYVECFSTDVDRTVDTARSVLIGLLTENQTAIGEPNCSCRPKGYTRAKPKCVAECIGVKLPKLPKVQVWNKASGNDIILRQYEACQGMDEWRQGIYATNEYKNASSSTFQSAFEYAENEILGGQSEVCPEEGDSCHELEIKDLSRMHDTALCLAAQQGDNNGPYKDLDEVRNKLLPPSTWYWHQLYSPEIGPSLGGILLDRIISNLEEGAKRKPSASIRVEQFSAPNQGPLMILYSAHDSTLASLLAAMNVTDWDIPLFTSRIVFELYGPMDPTAKSLPINHYIRVLYDDKPLVVGGCPQEFCLLQTFIDSLADRRQTKDACSHVP